MSADATRSVPTAVRRDALLSPLVAVGVGALAAVAPTVSIAVGAVGCLVLIAVAANRLRQAFLIALALLLGGYAFFGRAFAYLGLPPVFVGEMVLALGIVAMAGSAAPGGRRRWVLWVLLGFMAWGVGTTVPYLSRDGIDALRDAVLWAYGLYALVVVRALDARFGERVISLYYTVFPLFLIWIPIAVVTSTAYAGLPVVPGLEIPIVTVKLGDAGVHLAGIAAFVLLGLHPAPSRTIAAIRAPALPLFLLSLALVAVLNRGGLLAACCAGAALAAARPSKAWLVGALAVTVFGIGLALGAPLARTEIGVDRSLSVEQIGENLRSIVGETDSATLQGTRDFRLDWWDAIIDYTVLGPYFWTGKGFGVNLGRDDGFLTSPDDPARVPHNSHFTVLARMGVPGLLLWVALQAAFGTTLVAALARARASKMERRARVLVWILVYWASMLVNTSFDPYLESPMGGIWFWSMFGFGLAVASRDDWFRSASPQT